MMSVGDAQAIIANMRANGDAWEKASPEQRIALHDTNIALMNVLQQGGYDATYNSITGDYTIVGQSLYTTQPTGGSTAAGQGTGYYMQPPISYTPQPAGQQAESLLRADEPNIGGLIAIGTVLGLLFLFK